MRIVFFGTPDFALPSLQAAYDSGNEIVAVVTQPDKERDRRVMSFSPIKKLALKLGLKVLQYDKVSKEGVEELSALNADLFVTCAFGQILSQKILDIPPLGTINVHASLLPKYRGSAPIQWAIINGEKLTGITIMRTALKVDSGDILLQSVVEIGERENAGELFERLAKEGGATLSKALEIIKSGVAEYIPQNHDEATLCRMLCKEDGKIDFSLDAKQVERLIRGVTPWPSAYAYLDDKIFKVLSAQVSDRNISENCGTVKIIGKEALVACGNGSIKLCEVQLEGKKRQDISAFILGHDIDGKVLK